ncbi:MAG: membrane protein [Verrucomicrobia bacterium]|nr:MAG: membrane protein [Verrucomicrobiota bacterium]
MHKVISAFAQVRSALERERSACFLSRWLFLRLIGIIYLWTQIDGLIGHDGILPVVDYLKAVSERVGAVKYWWLPTFCWFNAGDASLHLQCGLGVVLSLLLIAGVAPVLDLVFLWAIYLSLSTVSRDFLGFQWDILLLETGFLAIFLAQRRWFPGFARETPPSVTVLWLCRWLLFRLMFMSGAVKLLSGDSTWWNLSALTVHYETQPLPTWIGWYAHQLPVWFQKASCGVMFGIELAAPFLIFCGRRARRIACGTFVLLMFLISLSGNYCFFNLLTVALCLLLLDDAFLLRLLPSSGAAFVKKRLTHLTESGSSPSETPSTALRAPSPPAGEKDRRRGHGSWNVLRTLGVGVLAAIILLVSGTETAARLFRAQSLPTPLREILQLVSPLRTVNAYGLFAVMTTTRPEIIVEGSDDGVSWLPYEFKWKPGDLKRPPAFVAPHQPRLDWQMWFAALGNVRGHPWFVNFLVRLLQGSPEVVALLEKNPFPVRPPRRIRAVLYEYHFTDCVARRATGDWWRREPKGMYCPEISLRQN